MPIYTSNIVHKEVATSYIHIVYTETVAAPVMFTVIAVSLKYCLMYRFHVDKNDNMI